MPLSDRSIKELQEIIKRDYGQTLSEEEANELGTSLLRLTRLALNHQLKADKKTNKQKS
jgi:flagellin-specific chaperone FliS